MKQTLLILIFFFLSSCTSSFDKAAWRIAEQSVTNSKELILFLEHYKGQADEEKYKAACFLIENMPNKYSLSGNERKRIYDIDIVKSDSLILSLEYSFRLKKESPYLKDYTFEQFCEYILPYRVANEPLQYYWKWDCVKRFTNGDNSDDIVKAAQKINAQVKIELAPEFYKDSLKSYAELLQTGYGKCDDRSALVVMALRSAGIPAAFEMIPYWGSSNNGHSFISMILPNDSVVTFQNDDENGVNTLPIRKIPKIYRKVYTITSKRLHSNYPAIEYSDLFANGDILDVTGVHRIGSLHVTVNAEKGKSVYLSVFSPGGWTPIAFSVDGNFQSVGTGTRKGIKDSEEALDLGNGILYLPSDFSNGEITPISKPIIVSKDGVHYLSFDTLHKETVTLTRKYPLNKRIVGFARTMVGGLFEGANRSDFSDAENIYEITKVSESRMQMVNTSSCKKYCYVRYRKPKGVFSIAEFSLFDSAGMPLQFQPIACEAILADSTMNAVFDNAPLTYYQVNGGFDLWIGADLGKQTAIPVIGFAPRNDDNSVVSTDSYELFYWNDKWISLGKKMPIRDNIVYENVPKGALLWLRDLTKGREERPFTYDNGRQIWW